jgi:hypothetical protein
MPLGSLCFSSQNVPCFSVLSSLFVAANLPCFSILSSMFVVANHLCFLLDLSLFILVRSLLSLCFIFYLSKSPPLCFSFFSSLLSLYSPPPLFFSFSLFWFPC